MSEKEFYRLHLPAFRQGVQTWAGCYFQRPGLERETSGRVSGHFCRSSDLGGWWGFQGGTAVPEVVRGCSKHMETVRGWFESGAADLLSSSRRPGGVWQLREAVAGKAAGQTAQWASIHGALEEEGPSVLSQLVTCSLFFLLFKISNFFCNWISG